ncbi:septum formation initiator [Micromonospora globbae]|uniref:Septum formation initiator n=1 Tax=Micromonospora globbae TaxID=1894969 RepID=A0A420EY08_9ACTN|nr:septum formation initiator [Micromonospora globbae]RKF25598.1 septum formation initiator [Micromonospora globbae]WTF87400.1 septum formation initiator [Micromonospora globbae]
MRRRWLLVSIGWLATAAVATLIGLGAIRLVGESITGTPGGVRGEDEIARALAADPPPSSPTGAPAATAAPATATPPAASPPAGARRSFATAGGTAVAECTPEGIRLVSWSPAQGFRARDADRGPDDDVEVRFEGAAGRYELKLRCLGGEPVAVEDD